jgi:hypothetical protein
MLAHPEDKAKFEHGGPVRLDLATWSVELAGGERVALEQVSSFVQAVWKKGGLLALLEAGHEPRG